MKLRPKIYRKTLGATSFSGVLLLAPGFQETIREKPWERGWKFNSWSTSPDSENGTLALGASSSITGEQKPSSFWHGFWHLRSRPRGSSKEAMPEISLCSQGSLSIHGIDSSREHFSLHDVIFIILGN